MTLRPRRPYLLLAWSVGCAAPDLGARCSEDRGLMSVVEVLLESGDDCYDWVGVTHGRAARVDAVGHGSASIWSLRTGSGVGVLVTAAHVMSPCWGIVSALEDQGEQPVCTQSFYEPSSGGEAQVRLSESGGFVSSDRSTNFGLFNPGFSIEDAQTGGLRPREDFSVYVVDSQRFEAYSHTRPVLPEPLVRAPPEVHDPAGLTTTVPSWGSVTAGDSVLSVGFPAEDGNVEVRRMSAAVGTVLDDEEARDVIALLLSLHDAEGEIAYDPEAEFIFSGSALPGMSGSGVFDANGTLVGILVRASFVDSDVQYLRAVRMSYVVTLIQSAFASEAAEIQVRIAPFLPPLISPTD